MIPSAICEGIKKSIFDFIEATFPITNPFFSGIIAKLFEKGNAVFKGPYISIKLPFRSGISSKKYFEKTCPDFTSYRHQEIAFERLDSAGGARSTIVATGTGSGKTECFEFPILDHCLRHSGEKGVKAILIYPMNALATDQARRFARD
ncbi:MAG: DEAD/DEAH box helicase, partial [Bacteroidales bacterium]|nr:DEAD/DEAH box helicase [Bacteroidales bacterium]